MRVIDPRRTVEYVCKNEEGSPESERTIFIIKPLEAGEFAQLEDMGNAFEGAQIKPKLGTRVLMILRFGLKGWKNLRNGSGNEIEFAIDGEGKPTDTMLDYLPNEVRWELSDAIISMSRLSKEQIKN